MDAAPPAPLGPPTPAEPELFTAWPRSAQWTTACLLILAVVLIAAHSYGYLRYGTRPADLERPEPPRRPLTQPAAGGRVEVRTEPVAQAASPPTTRSKPLSKKAIALNGRRIDVNRASEQELQLLPWVGRVTAQNIIEERNRRPFRSVEDMDRVPGIGPKIIEELRPHVAFGNPDHVAAEY
jgi:competence ComEA-like helix-hairpin-helix protein